MSPPRGSSPPGATFVQQFYGQMNPSRDFCGWNNETHVGDSRWSGRWLLHCCSTGVAGKLMDNKLYRPRCTMAVVTCNSPFPPALHSHEYKILSPSYWRGTKALLKVKHVKLLQSCVKKISLIHYINICKSEKVKQWSHWRHTFTKVNTAFRLESLSPHHCVLQT